MTSSFGPSYEGLIAVARNKHREIRPADLGVAFEVIDDPSIDTTSRTGKLVMGILALIAEFSGSVSQFCHQLWPPM